ncbi:hypothetical protein [Methylobacterium sp. Leaf86]
MRCYRSRLRAGPARPVFRQPAKSHPMTVLVLVVAGNILLATLFSLVALASD